VVFVLSACGRADTSLADVTRRGYLVVGMDASFPPFETVAADGSLEGLDVDLARLVAAQMGLAVQFRNVSFDGLYDALAAGQVDAIISAMPYDGLRTQDVRYTPAYFDDGLVPIGPPGEAPLAADALRGTVAVEMGSEAAALARESSKVTSGGSSAGASSGSAREVTLRQVLSEQEVIAAVAAGSADAGLVTRLSACQAVAAGTPIAIGPALSAAPYVAAVRADRPALAAAVSDAVTAVLASDAWSTDRARWLGEACR
jgi:ABC-type amino acid transport substrate-binding protein